MSKKVQQIIIKSAIILIALITIVSLSGIF